MFTPSQIEAAEAAAFAANGAKTRMDEATTAFEAAQTDFNRAMRVAELVFSPTRDEKTQRKEFLNSPLGIFIKDETERITLVDGKEAAANISFEDWSTVFDVREQLAHQLPVDVSDLHVVLAPNHETEKPDVSLLYTAERGIHTAGNWEDLMADTPANRKAYLVTLDDGRTYDCRLGMTKRNYQALIWHVSALDPNSEIDKFVPYGSGDKQLPQYDLQPWLTGEPVRFSNQWTNKRAATVGFVEDKTYTTCGYPCTISKFVHLFRPGVIISSTPSAKTVEPAAAE